MFTGEFRQIRGRSPKGVGSWNLPLMFRRIGAPYLDCFRPRRTRSLRRSRSPDPFQTGLRMLGGFWVQYPKCQNPQTAQNLKTPTRIARRGWTGSPKRFSGQVESSCKPKEARSLQFPNHPKPQTVKCPTPQILLQSLQAFCEPYPPLPLVKH